MIIIIIIKKLMVWGKFINNNVKWLIIGGKFSEVWWIVTFKLHAEITQKRLFVGFGKNQRKGVRGSVRTKKCSKARNLTWKLMW